MKITRNENPTPSERDWPYAYHIAYQFSTPTSSGFGSMTYFRRVPIGRPDDLEEIRRDIKIDGHETAGVVILSWQPFPGWGMGL